ncbi:hypothetical protein P3G55_10110 [Leptospira sp. 96542]|nr:hypothetical protein [Leptospira sp. 96542]
MIQNFKRRQNTDYLIGLKIQEFIVTFQEVTFAMGKVMNDRSVYASLYISFRDDLLNKCD